MRMWIERDGALQSNFQIRIMRSVVRILPSMATYHPLCRKSRRTSIQMAGSGLRNLSEGTFELPGLLAPSGFGECTLQREVSANST